jgi:hypothetical protein
MVASPTYERYCRERKATLDKERSLERSRSMSGVVDEILEIISTDEDVLRKAKRETSMHTSETSYATWSLSSSAILTSWPSISTTEDGDDGFDTIQKSIQSYTSQLFSPLYEIRADQKNVFQENRQPLPKPGRTPKLRNLCYNLGTQLSFEQVDDFMYINESDVAGKHSSVDRDSLSKHRPTQSHKGEISLPNVSPLVVMSAAEVLVRNMKTASDQTSLIPKQPLLYGLEDRKEKFECMTPSYKFDEMGQEYSHIQMNPSPWTYDEIYARKDWMLRTHSSVDSGELSLEPLLNAYSEDIDAEETRASEELNQECMDGEEKKCENVDNFLTDTVGSTQSDNEIVRRSCELLLLHYRDREQPLLEAGLATKMDKKDIRNRKIVSGNTPVPLRIAKYMLTSNYEFLQHVTLNVPLSPALLISLNTSFLTVSSLATEERRGRSILVKSDKDRFARGGMTSIGVANQELSLVRDENSSRKSTTGCFMLDLDSFCLQLSDWRIPVNQMETFDCGHKNMSCVGGKNGFKDSLECLTEKNTVRNVKRQSLYSKSNILVEETEYSDCFELSTDALPKISRDRENETEAIETIDFSFRDNELQTVFELTTDGNDGSALFPTMSADSCPTSFDSEQFLKDMTLRIESELSNRDSSNFNDDATTSTIFPELSMNLYSSSSESDDGLDQEICALQMFEVNLKKEIDKANDTSVLFPLTSPIQTIMSSKSSNCSMTTTFLSEYDASASNSSDGRMFHIAAKVRKVHFNEQVEEFLYSANEACGTPDAKAAELYRKDESFVDEICSVFDDILDEFSNACIFVSNAMDRTKHLSKLGPIRRSSVH